MTIAPPIPADAQARALARGWSAPGLERMLDDKARALGGIDMTRGHNDWFRYWRFRNSPAELQREILDKLDSGRWDHMKDVWHDLACLAERKKWEAVGKELFGKAPGVPGQEPELKGTEMGLLEDMYGTGDYLKTTGEGTLALPGNPEEIALTIAGQGEGSFPDGKKQIVVTFAEKDANGQPIKPLGLNITNCRSIHKLSGKLPDNNGWVGVRIQLFVVPETEKSKTGYAIRVKKPTGSPAGSSAPAPALVNPDGPLGPQAELKMTAAIAEMAKEAGDSCSTDALRTFLVSRYPDLESTFAGPAAGWPRKVGPDFKAWLDGQAVPF